MNYDSSQSPNESNFAWKERLIVDKMEDRNSLKWAEILEILKLNTSESNFRKSAYGIYEAYLARVEQSLEEESKASYKETFEIQSDGTQKSDKLIKMSEEQKKNPEFLLTAHGFDPKEWDLINVRNNIWNTNSKTQGVQTLYSSKISVKPKSAGFNFDKLLETIGQKVEPITVERPKSANEKMLEIPLFDMHWGIAGFDHYFEVFHKIDSKIKSNKWDTVLFVIGQDLLHVDGFTGKTTSGTQVESIDLEKAWSDADKFYSMLLAEALRNSKNVEVIFSAGNHDQSMGFAFVKMLEAKFIDVAFDTKMQTRKGFVWKDIFLGFTHGDKGGKRIVRNFLTEYGKEIAIAKVVEVHSGHLHREELIDDFGIVFRVLSTGNKTDDWHREQGWIGANKRFQLFEYSPSKLEAIYYV